MAANLTQILNFKVNFHQELELFFLKVYANNGGHFKIVSIIKNNQICPHKSMIRPYNFKK